MVRLKYALQRSKNDLFENGIENSAFEAKELFKKAFGKEPVYFDPDLYIQEDEYKYFRSLTDRRLSGEPLQYILGEWEFYSLTFKVGKGVLIPRQDTETLVDNAVRLYKNEKDIVLIDLCSGSGCIGIAIEKNTDCSRVLLVEKSEEALKYLRENVKLNSSCAEIVLGNALDKSVMDKLPQADLIVSNPPYLSESDMKSLQTEVGFEPEEALSGGDDGLDFYRDLSRLYKQKLKPGGRLIFEIGINQETEVSGILISNGYKNVRARKDLCGVNRVVIGEKTDE